MAVIMKIRNRFSAVIIGLIALAIVSFLLMDALNSNSNLLQGNGTTAGKIAGKEIDIKEFEKRYQENIENYKKQIQQDNVDDQTALALREQTWNTLVSEVLLSKEYEKLGIQVTADELFDLVQGSNPHPQVVQAFSDPNTKKFDPNQVVMFLQNMDNDTTGDTRERWLNFEKFLKEDRLKNKYNALIKKGFYVPNWLAKKDYEIKNTGADFDYVFLPYAEIKDEEVKVTDEDLKAYINKNKARYQVEESRSMEYVTFDIKASKGDTSKALSWLEGQRSNFESAENDSIFIKLNSDKSYDEKYYSQTELVSSLKDTFFNIAPKTIVGPYMENGFYILAKLVDRKMLADSVRARHILLVPTKQEEIETKRKQADSIKTAIEGGADFNQLALQFSKDDKTKLSGGDWGLVKPGEKFETINKDLFFTHKQGDVFVTGSNEGFHVIQITSAVPTKTAVKVAFLNREISASKETQRGIFDEASKFAAANNTLQKFSNSNLKTQIKKASKILRNDYTIFGIGTSRDVVKWAYEAKVGDVSTVFSLDDKYAVVALTNLSEKGTASVDNVRDEVKPLVIKEKKAVLLEEKIKKANATSLTQLASSLGKSVLNATGVNFNNNFLPSAGPEPKVSNRAFASTVNTLSKSIEGDNGVYVIQVKNIIAAPATTDYNVYKQQVKMPLEQKADGGVFEALKKISDVVDERYKFY